MIDSSDLADDATIPVVADRGHPRRSTQGQLSPAMSVQKRGEMPEACTMTQPRLKRLNPFLRDAAVSFVPEMTDDRLVRVARRLNAWHPDVLVSRLSDFTALVQGIAVEAETAHDADLVTWAAISTEMREMLDTPDDVGTEMTSIDVRMPEQSTFDLG
jgi:hypothetical protein